MSVSFTPNRINLTHPIEHPHITGKIKAFNELIEKIRKMEPVTLYCAMEEHDGGEMGASTYTYTWCTNKENAQKKANTLYYPTEIFQKVMVKDEYEEIYDVVFETGLELKKLDVVRSQEEKVRYDAIQKKKQRLEEKERLEAALARVNKELEQST